MSRGNTKIRGGKLSSSPSFSRPSSSSSSSSSSLTRPDETSAAAEAYVACRRELHARGRLAFPQGNGSTKLHIKCRNAYNALQALSPAVAARLSTIEFPRKHPAVIAKEEEEKRQQGAGVSSSIQKTPNVRPDIEPRPASVPSTPAAGKPSASAAPPSGPKGADSETPSYMQEEEVVTTVATDPIVLLSEQQMSPAAQPGLMGFVKRHKLLVGGGVIALGLAVWFITRR